MANETIIKAVNATSQSVDVAGSFHVIFTYVFPEIFRRFWVFFSAPFVHLDMWWLLIHLVLTFILFEFYFERHESENLGWSAALANSIVMIFISMELLRSLYHHEGNPFEVMWKVVTGYFSLGFTDFMFMVTLVLILFFMGILTAVINYFHFLPRQLAWLISGHKTVNLLAYFLIVVVWKYEHGHPIPIDELTLIGFFLYGLLLWALIFFINSRQNRKLAAGGRRRFFN